ncbi:unnamed protein product [Zymoseptoria tritici ST99CH_1E4]|uniref:Lipocalin-like domain-containing protein n=1 Tax=Zymoseptoria tritici ST99CH_1E4 TaxID=1276532 RepID=A0A2H1GIY5_ZYMTR|nr:unnamed protein product [Zymoseptoria tritici ST99CH_1E4]
MPTATMTTRQSDQYLQVPKRLHNRKARSKSRERASEIMTGHVDIPSDSQVIVSPQKLSFRSRSPPLPIRPEPFRRAASYNNLGTPAHNNGVESPLAVQSIYTPPTPLRVTTLTPPPSKSPYQPFSPPPLSPPLTPPPTSSQRQSPSAPTLRSLLIGTWTLESYIAYPTPSSPLQRPTFPMTRSVTGFILYTPDGYMSATMLIPGQKPFSRSSGTGGNDEAQWAEAGKRCFGYCGPYYISPSPEGDVDEHGKQREVLRHTFQCCSLPGWVGDVQVRTHRFEEEGEVLVLGSEGPTEIKGDKRIPVLKWRRARDNSTASPPAPTPQIKISGPGEP